MQSLVVEMHFSSSGKKLFSHARKTITAYMKWHGCWSAGRVIFCCLGSPIRPQMGAEVVIMSQVGSLFVGQTGLSTQMEGQRCAVEPSSSQQLFYNENLLKMPSAKCNALCSGSRVIAHLFTVKLWSRKRKMLVVNNLWHLLSVLDLWFWLSDFLWHLTKINKWINK